MYVAGYVSWYILLSSMSIQLMDLMLSRQLLQSRYYWSLKVTLLVCDSCGHGFKWASSLLSWFCKFETTISKYSFIYSIYKRWLHTCTSEGIKWENKRNENKIMVVNLVEDKLKNCFKTLKENKWCIGEDVKFKIYYCKLSMWTFP